MASGGGQSKSVESDSRNKTMWGRIGGSVFQLGLMFYFTLAFTLFTPMQVATFLLLISFFVIFFLHLTCNTKYV